MPAGRPKEWQARLDVMEELGWPASRHEWPAFLAALKKECCFVELADRLGFSIPTLVSDLADGGFLTQPKKILVDGVPLKEIARQLGVSYHAVYKRYRKGQNLYAGSNRQPRRT